MTQNTVFQFFNEIGIINQLSSTMLNRKLPDGLHVSHFSVLNHLVRLGDGASPMHLADAFQVTRPTMTHTLATLSKRGFIKLEPHPGDGRSKVVLLTPQGREFRDSAIESLAPAIALLGTKLDLEQVAELVPHLSRIRDILDNNRDI